MNQWQSNGSRIIGGKFWLRINHDLVADVLRAKRLRDNSIPEVRKAA